MSIPSTTELSPGAEIEVRTHYQGSWARGFEVASVTGDRVGVRRRSDGSLLPVDVDRKEVRHPRSADDSPWMVELHAIASMRGR
jgi:hypothetical protein